MNKLAVEIGFVFALRQEAVGILDKLKHALKTRGNGWTFYTGTLLSRTLGNVSVAVVISGVGQKNAEEAANILIEIFAPKLVCSAGYAGGLSKRLKQFTLCVPEQVVRESGSQALDLSMQIPQKSLPIPNRFTLLTVNNVVELPKQKRKLHCETGAELVDMETFAVAEVCRTRKIPFLACRIVYDAVDDRIPKDISQILDGIHKGIPRFSGTLLGSVWSRPSMVFDLVSLKKRAFIATERLTHFVLAELQRRKKNEIPIQLERLTVVQ